MSTNEVAELAPPPSGYRLIAREEVCRGLEAWLFLVTIPTPIACIIVAGMDDGKKVFGLHGNTTFSVDMAHFVGERSNPSAGQFFIQQS